LHHAYHLFDRHSGCWQDFDNALIEVARFFEKNLDPISVLKQGAVEVDDDDIKYLNYIYFKYNKLTIGFQQTCQHHVDSPYLIALIALDMNLQEIPFNIFDW
jgi:hypothetical protein